MTLSSSKDKSKGVILHTAYEDAYLPSVKLWAGRWAHWASDTWPVQNQTYVIFSSTEHHCSLTCTKLHFLPTMARVCDHLFMCVQSHEMMVGVKSQTCDFLISNHIQYLNHHTTSHIPIPLPNHAQRLFNASKHNNTKSQSHKTKSIWSDQGSW